MESTRSSSLQELIEGILTTVIPERVHHWIAGILTQLEQLHHSGRVHGAICPANILVDEHDNITLRLTDETDDKVIDARYLSPEQVAGITTDHRTDIYSAGAVIYRLLTGVEPLSSDSEFGMRLAHLEQFPAEPRTLQPSISPRVDQLLMQTLKKDRNDRPASCAEIKQIIIAGVQGETSNSDIEHLLEADESIQLPTVDYPNRRRLTFNVTRALSLMRLRLPIILLTLVSTIGIIVRYAGYTMNQPVPQSVPHQVTASVNLSLERQFEARWIRFISGREKPDLGQVQQQITNLGSTPDAETALLIAVLIEHHRFPEALQLARSAIARSPEQGLWHELLGNALYGAGNGREAFVAWQTAHHLSQDSTVRAIREGNCYLYENHWDKAEQNYREAFLIRPFHPQLNARLAEALAGQAHQSYGRRDLSKAIQQMECAVSLLQSKSTHYFRLGQLLAETGAFRQAEPYFRRAVEINPTCAACLNDLGSALNELGEESEAIKAIKDALRLEPNNPLFIENYERIVTKPDTAQRDDRQKEQVDRRSVSPGNSLPFEIRN
jgi:tetratricopeptide (TPR) repeat protein